MLFSVFAATVFGWKAGRFCQPSNAEESRNSAPEKRKPPMPCSSITSMQGIQYSSGISSTQRLFSILNLFCHLSLKSVQKVMLSKKYFSQKSPFLAIFSALFFLSPSKKTWVSILGGSFFLKKEDNGGFFFARNYPDATRGHSGSKGFPKEQKRNIVTEIESNPQNCSFLYNSGLKFPALIGRLSIASNHIKAATYLHP